VAELADALDSKSSDRKIVWVRAPPPADRSCWLSKGKLIAEQQTDSRGATENDRERSLYWLFIFV
jgi:hypothetical protein